MLVENQKLEVTWSNSNKKHYISKGYTFTKNLDKFMVDAKDLPNGSGYKVDVICDNCGIVKHMTYSDYVRCHQKHEIDLCSHCRNISAQITWMNKYGVAHPLKDGKVKEKSVNTCLIKYGYSNPMQNQDIQNKAKNTLFKKYGVLHPLQNEQLHQKANQACIDKYGYACVFESNEIKDKIKQTCLKKYGTENPMQALEIKEKAFETNKQKYGYTNPMKNQEVQEKALKTFYKNGTCPTSSQQLLVSQMLNEIYGNCELNYPCGQCLLDCVINVNGTLIDVEYDGQYWHKDARKDLKRDMFVSTQGYKILRIKGNYAIPTIEQIKDAVDYLVKGNHKHTIITLDI